MKDPNDLYTLDMFQKMSNEENLKLVRELFTKNNRESETNDNDTETSSTGC